MATTVAAEAAHTVLPPKDLAELRSLVSFVDSHRQRAALVGPDGERVDLPDVVYQVLTDVVDAMKVGRAITVAPTSMKLTTQEAADLLGVSRPTLVKLLESGRIAYEQPGRHRRVRLVDLLAYQDAARVDRRAALDELTRDAVAARAYDRTTDEFRDALKRSRRRRRSKAVD
jgi:excisionase family DNA binding protein